MTAIFVLFINRVVTLETSYKQLVNCIVYHPDGWSGSLGNLEMPSEQ